MCSKSLCSVQRHAQKSLQHPKFGPKNAESRKTRVCDTGAGHDALKIPSMQHLQIEWNVVLCARNAGSCPQVLRAVVPGCRGVYLVCLCGLLLL